MATQSVSSSCSSATCAASSTTSGAAPRSSAGSGGSSFQTSPTTSSSASTTCEFATDGRRATGLEAAAGELDTGLDVKLPEDLVQVVLDRVRADEQSSGDFS